MVSISLRAYNNEINDLVDENQIDEAIAHCRHILEHYPKHVDTYRLLGKAYLEEQRYGDAADILQRVLSSVPEDFIAQVGMSIIREDEGNLDSAIYHMERAFETQPSNHAIQNELRRLNTKRDGIELTRVRLTRGALARMYAHGHLYDQAISELLAALSENPNRFDLQNLLAEMYSKTDKKVDAAETCTKILEKLPYCINANKLLTQILEESGRSEEANRYRQRWIALDPYAKFVGEEFPLIDTVPDNHVSLEHIEWDPTRLYEEDEQPAWASSLGLSLSDEDAESGEPIPDWLEGATGDEIDDLRPTEMLTPDEDDPLFQEESAVMDGNRIGLMPQAESEDEVQTDDWLSGFDDSTQETEPSSEEEDWLTSLESPSEETEPTGEDIFGDKEESDDTDDWLASLEVPSDEPESEAEDPFSAEDEADEDAAWLALLEEKAADTLPTQDEAPAADPENELPDFLKEAGWKPGTGELDESTTVDLEEEEELAEAEIPDWIKEMAPAEDETEEKEDLTAEADPEWMKSLEAPASGPADWLKELEKDESLEDQAQEPEAGTEQPETEIPVGQEIEADDAGMAWLENLAAKQGIPDEEMTTTAEQRADVTEEDVPLEMAGFDLPDTLQSQPESGEERLPDTDWLEQIGSSEEAEQAEEEPAEEPGDGTSAWLASIQQDESAQPESGENDTISRFLAAKAVLGDEDVTETPVQEEPTAPDWLSEDAAEPAEEIPESPSPVDEEADSFDDSWLEAIGEEAAAEAAEEEPSEDAWLSEDTAKPVEEMPESPSPVDEEADSLDDSWLEAIGEEAAAEEAAEAEPAEDDWLAEARGTADTETDEEVSTDWLKAISQEDEEPLEVSEEAFETPSPVDEEADSFDESWLEAIGKEAAQEAVEEEPAPSDEAMSEDVPFVTREEEPGKETPSPVDEEADSFDTSWLDAIGTEAALEASAGEESAPVEDKPVTEEWLADVTQAAEEEEEPSTDWLKAISQEDEEGIESEEETIEAINPEEEGADDIDDDWLASISAEAAQEAEEEPAPVEEAFAEDDWVPPQTEEPVEEIDEPVSPVDEEEDDFDMDWLDEISTEAAEQAVDGEPSPPVDEELDAFDMDWLDELGSEAAEEEPAPVDEAPAENEWGAVPPEAPVEETIEPVSIVDEEEDDFDADWLAGISEEAAAEASEEEQAPSTEAPDEDEWLTGLAEEPAEETLEPITPVDEDQEDLDESWLEDIGTEAAEEAEKEIIPSAEETEPAVEEAQPPIEAQAEDWLSKFDEDDDETSQPESIVDTDAWLHSMEEGKAEDEATEEAINEVTDSDEWLTTLDIEPDEEQIEAEAAPLSLEELPEEEPVQERAEEAVHPTLTDEWKPESEIEPAAEPEPDPLVDHLDSARQYLQENELGEALKTYGAIIKKGKLVEEVIQDLTEATSRHPINVKLWQTLGDAHLRIDHLQDALDAYSKAEDLLR